jgi:hypothetical protein
MKKSAHDSAPVKNETEARQGETSGHMRWVLLASTLLAILAMFLAVYVFERP